ncbi:MAG: transglutaminase domain protein [Verrucomicrobiales bacterium]|jgi:transglutaminase-like putative cysteine protease|nr:transglutaminase domain protein [Verrucomicrobiales bacterium]
MKPTKNSLQLARMPRLLGALFFWVATLLSVSADTIFTVRQTFTVKDLPEGAKNVRGWFWMPEDRPEQRVLEFRVMEAPSSMRITRDPRYGRSWIYAETPATEKPLRVVTEFKVLRKSVSGMADASRTGAITEAERRTFARELNLNEKNMEVTAEISKVADEIAGKETNPVLQAKKFFQYVIDNSEHYSKHGSSPKGLCIGSAKECMAGTGDCCTDQHALFIALCRARSIPCRLMFGSRLKPENEGKDHDPGYRCWPNFYARGLGWIPLDVSSADAAPAERAGDWFGGLDENRLEWAEGRDFDLEPRSSVRPDLVIRGWVEVDGKQHKGLDRTVTFTRQVQAKVSVASTGSGNHQK